jgi:hypothetical protein
LFFRFFFSSSITSFTEFLDSRLEIAHRKHLMLCIVSNQQLFHSRESDMSVKIAAAPAV